MSRVALVTGGSRGIGAAISTALKDAGYTVAATYAGNDEKAAAFTAETGIKTYKWDVGNYEACAEGIAHVEADLGPVEVLVNNAATVTNQFLDFVGNLPGLTGQAQGWVDEILTGIGVASRTARFKLVVVEQHGRSSVG